MSSSTTGRSVIEIYKNTVSPLPESPFWNDLRNPWKAWQSSAVVRRCLGWIRLGFLGQSWLKLSRPEAEASSILSRNSNLVERKGKFLGEKKNTSIIYCQTKSNSNLELGMNGNLVIYSILDWRWKRWLLVSKQSNCKSVVPKELKRESNDSFIFVCPSAFFIVWFGQMSYLLIFSKTEWNTPFLENSFTHPRSWWTRVWQTFSELVKKLIIISSCCCQLNSTPFSEVLKAVTLWYSIFPPHPTQIR